MQDKREPCLSCHTLCHGDLAALDGEAWGWPGSEPSHDCWAKADDNERESCRQIKAGEQAGL